MRVDQETGEVKQEFEVTDEATAEWLGERLSEIAGTITGLQARKESLIARMDTLIAERASHLDGMLFKYGPSLTAYASCHLPKDGKTYTNPFVAVSFRDVPARIGVKDTERALEYARQKCPDAVKTEEKVLVSMVTDDQLPPTGTEQYAACGFERVPQRVASSIKILEKQADG